MDLLTILGLTAGAIVLICLISVAIYVLTVIAYWKIFRKAGEPGWKSIIPIYNGHVLFKICWKPIYYWLMIIAYCLVSVLIFPSLLSSGTVSTVLWIISGALSIFALVIAIKHCFKLSRAFGHKAGFGIGLMFLGTLFVLILGLGKSEYTLNKAEKEEA